jgi:frataxin-like iron-binding protein CyaY
MFKKYMEKIDALSELIKNNFYRQCEEHTNTRSTIRSENNSLMLRLDNMSKTITSQQRTIEQLTNALKDKYEHGLFIVSEDCKVPMVIRNGKEITNNLTSCFSIEWTHGESPNIVIEQFAGTVSDMENEP